MLQGVPYSHNHFVSRSLMFCHSIMNNRKLVLAKTYWLLRGLKGIWFGKDNTPRNVI